MHRPILVLAMVFAAACNEPAPPFVDEVKVAPPKPEPPAEPALPSWRFVEVSGDVQIDGAPAAKDMAIGSTSTLEVAAGGHALITLGERSIIEVREKTKLTLGTSARKKISARLLAGQLWSFFGGGADYEVITDNAVAGVRGTVFYVNAEDPKKTVVCACSHAVHLESLDPKKPSKNDVTAAEWEHLGTAFVREGERIETEELGAYANPPNHPDARGKEILALMPE